jgi:hypothetical protein
MTNRIERLRIVTRNLSPVEAELLVVADAAYLTPETELVGRFTGPTCAYATTVEVAYPLRRLPQPVPDLPLARRVVIPEPSLWDPVSPFLYHSTIELWQGGDMHERRQSRHGLRVVALRPDGLRWNGKRLKLRVAPGPEIDADQLPALRAEGFNSLIADWPDPPLFAAAERVGFVVMSRPAAPDLEEESDSPSLLAWLLPDGWREEEAKWVVWVARQRRLVAAAPDGRPLPPGVSFVVGDTDQPLPRLLPDAEGEMGRIG